MSRLVSLGFMLVGLIIISVVVVFLFLGVTGQDVPFMGEDTRVEYEFKKKEIEAERVKELSGE